MATSGGVELPVRITAPGRPAIDAVVPMAAAPGLDLAGFAAGDDLALSDPRARRRARRPDPEGRITALRGVIPVVPFPPPAALVAPDVVATNGSRPEPASFPLAAVATSAITASVAAVFFSPIFALLAGVSAVAMIGRWLGSHGSARRAHRRRQEAMAVATREWNRVRTSWTQAEAEARRSDRMDPPALLESTGWGSERPISSPWSTRLDPSGDLVLTVGVGTISVPVPSAPAEPAVGVVDPRTLGLDLDVDLDAVPIDWAVGQQGGLAVCGDRAHILASARWLVASAATTFGPADLALAIVTTADRVADWDWVKWVPSLEACVVVDVDGYGALTTDAPGITPSRPCLVVVDGAEPVGPSPLARLLAGRVDTVRLLWMGDADAVPGGCGARLDVAADGSAHLVTPERTTELEWYGLRETEADAVARWLAPFDDPEVDDAGGRLPRSISVDELVGWDLSDEASRAVQSAWRRASPRSLTATIGVDADGPHVVDLVADGPHVLAAGTTGAGKSELLRTLVVSMAAAQPPELASFVLIDFKGGGAFDIVADLPHVAAVVTDLDRSEASRALRGLRAELMEREHRLRDMGCSDLVDVDRRHSLAFGRLVVIVDEFAALADELPDFLDGLVDIARRGRSLGVHLVLATQRPSGVVTGQIRSNTNLRICLRVQDRADSADVIDVADAAQLPQIPGRAIVQRGGGGRSVIQVAQIAAPTVASMVRRFVVHPAVPASGEQRVAEAALAEWWDARSAGSSARESADRPQGAPVVEQLAQAATALDVARATAPWRPPLTSVGYPVVPPRAIEGIRPMEGPEVVVGLLDDPDRRRTVPLVWDPERDGLLIVGVDQHEIAQSSVTAVCTLLDRPRIAPPPVFVFDGCPGRSGPLGGLSALDPVIDVIGVDEPERLVKAVDHVAHLARPSLLVIHDWQSIVDVITDEGGPSLAEKMIRTVRRTGTGSASVIVTARSDRDVPQRAAAQLGCRLVHRLGDPAGYLSFGLRPHDLPDLRSSAVVDPASGLTGMVGRVDAAALGMLERRLAGRSVDLPPAVRVLGDRVDHSQLPATKAVEGGWQTPLGLDEDLAPHWVDVLAARPVIVVGHPGTGRSTTLTRLATTDLGDGTPGPCIIDDADRLDDETLGARLDRAEASGRAVVLACGPADLRRFGSPMAALASRATLVVLNPGRAEADAVRLPLPDLSNQPVGRAAVVDRGRVTVVQVAV